MQSRNPRSITFPVVGVAQSKGSMRAFLPKGSQRPIVTSTNRSLRSWETLVRGAASEAVTRLGWPLPSTDTPLTAYVSVALPRPKSLGKRQAAHTKRPDLDKLVRGVLDALTGIIYLDDSQIVSVQATKQYAHGDEPPCCWIRVTEHHGL